MLLNCVFASCLQDMLFNKIQDGEFTFPQEEWRSVSDDAKDLIRHMLVRNPRQRYAAFEVLKHRWVTQESSRQQLATPRILQRSVDFEITVVWLSACKGLTSFPVHQFVRPLLINFLGVCRTNSIKGLEAFADNANAYNRMLLNHLSISEAYHGGSALFSVGDVPWEDVAEQCARRDSEATDSGLAGDGDYGLMFSIGDDDLGDEASSGDEPNSSGDDDFERLRRLVATSGMSLSPPSMSALARRRMRSNSSSGDSFDLDKENLSPHKIPSAIF